MLRLSGIVTGERERRPRIQNTDIHLSPAFLYNHCENPTKREMQGKINLLLSRIGFTAICLGQVCVYLLTLVQFSSYTSCLCQTSRKLPVTSNVIFVFSLPVPSQ